MTYKLRLTERMTGAFAFGQSAYVRGFLDGLRAGSGGHGQAATSGGGVMFRLTIRVADVDAFVADPTHAATADGYVRSDPLGGHLPVEAGAFNLFVDEGPRTRHMLYRLYFSDASGRPLTLAGFKDIKPGPLTKVWPDTSTLYTRVLTGHVPVSDGGQSVTEGVVGSGLMRIRPADFARQLTTFRASGPSLGGELRALGAFGRLFLAELWEVFDPVLGLRSRFSQ